MDTCRSQHEASLTLFAAATDEFLVAAAKSGDHMAFAELWERHSKKAFHMIHRITGNLQDAEDALQDAWMKAFAHLKAFDGRARFSTWLTRIAINTALMSLRRKRAHPETSMEIPDGESWRCLEFADQAKDVEEVFAMHESAAHLKRAIRRLRPPLRKVIEIHQRHDMTVKEIAAVTGISVSATKSRMLRARVILRRAFC